MTLMWALLGVLKSSKTTANDPSARCSKATEPDAGPSTLWNMPFATVAGVAPTEALLGAAGLGLTMVAGGG